MQTLLLQYLSVCTPNTILSSTDSIKVKSNNLLKQYDRRTIQRNVVDHPGLELPTRQKPKVVVLHR